MQILDNLIILTLIVLSFVAGLRVDNHYHQKADLDRKEALEKQFVRLRAKADADDPVRPYGTPQVLPPIPINYSAPAGPITQEFMDELKTTGKAKTSFRKPATK